MNKGYTYIDGKVIISDENGNHTQSEYYDNLDKVLVQENIIEEMENKIKKIEREIDDYPEAKKKYIPKYFYAVLGCVLTMTPFLMWLLTGSNPSLGIDKAFGSVDDALFFTLLIEGTGLELGAIVTYADYSNFKKKAKRGNGLNTELEFLKSQIEKEKETLASLKKEKTRDNENTKFRSTQVDDKQQLEALDSYSTLYYVLGYDEKEFGRLYQQGKLVDKMQRHYSNKEIELANNYFEEKGPVLAKKRINKY